MVLYDYVKTHRSVHHEERILLYVNKKKRLTMMWKELKMKDRLWQMILTVVQRNGITALKGVGMKGTDLSNFEKQSFDWIM